MRALVLLCFLLLPALAQADEPTLTVTVDALSDREIELIVDYLKHMAGRKP